MSSNVETAARYPVVFREVNERIAELSKLFDDIGVNLFVCECSDPACAESLEITTLEYEAVRASPIRFVVLEGHVLPETDRVVDAGGSFVVVEKLGVAAQIAEASSHRS